MVRTIAAMLVLIAPAHGGDRLPLSVPVIPAAAVPMSIPVAKPECMCRLRSGRRVPLGTRTCIRVGSREYVAECRLSQNVSTWREIANGCPTS